MMPLHQYRNRSGTTLAETMMYVTIAVILSCVTYTFLTGATQLYAKNMSLVHSHNDMRSVLDRTLNNMQQGNSLPKLIDTTGATAATPPSAGVYYDSFRGDPYVITNPSGSGLTAGTTSVTITCSTAALASPPAPAANDAIIISNPGDRRADLHSHVAAGVGFHAIQRAASCLSLLMWTPANCICRRAGRKAPTLTNSPGKLPNTGTRSTACRHCNWSAAKRAVCELTTA